MDNKHNIIDETAIERFSRTLKTCIFRFYYSILSKQFSMNVLYIVILTIEFIQIIGLTNFNVLYSGREFNKESMAKMTNILDSLKYIFNLSPSGNYLASSIIMYILVFLFIFQVGFYLYFKNHEINSKTKTSFLYDIILRFFLILNILYKKMFHIPIWVILFSFIQCESKGSYLNFSNQTCSDVNYYVNLALAIMGIVLFLFISCLNCEFLKDSRPISIVPWASPNNRISYYYLIMKLIISFFYVFKFTDEDSPLFDIKVCSLLIIFVLILIFRFFSHFFYHKSVGGFIIVYEGAFVFNSAFSLVNMYIKTVYTLEFLLVQISTSLFFGLLIYFIIENISDHIIHSNINSITNEHMAHYKLLLLLECANSYKEDNCKKNLFLGLLQKHRLKCFAEKCNCHSYIRSLNQSKSNENKAIMMFDYIIHHKEKKKKVVLDGAQNMNSEENAGSPKGKFATDKQLKKMNLSKIMRKKRNLKRSTSDNSLNKEEDVIEFDDSAEFAEENGDNLAGKDNNGNEISDPDCIYGTIRIYLDSLVKNFPTNSDLNVFYAYLMTYYMNNIYKALFELMKVYKRKTDVSREFEIYFLHMEIEKIMYSDYISTKDEDFHIENVLTYNDMVNEVLELMNKTAHETILFWTEVGVKPPGQQSTSEQPQSSNKNNKSMIYEHAMNISNNIKKLKEGYMILSDGVKFRNKIILKLYCLFLEKIIFNEHDSLEIRERLKIYDKDSGNFSHLRHNQDNGDYLSSFVNMDEVGTVVISGNLHDIGKVLIVNHLFCSFFKYERDEINKHSINKVIPAYLAQYHDGFIKRYLETAKKHVLDQIRMVFGISSVGLLTPILLHVKIIPNLEDSIRFIGLTKKMQKNHPFFQVPDTDLKGFIISSTSKDISFIMCNEKGKVFGITKPALKQYGIPLNVLYTNMAKGEDQGQGKELNIKNIIPNIDDEEVVNQMKSENGCILKLDTRFLKSALEDYKEALQEGNSVILKSLKKFSASKAFGEHLVLIFSYDISFDDGQVPAKIYKILNVIPKSNKKMKIKYNQSILTVGGSPEKDAANNTGHQFTVGNINNSILSKTSGLTHHSGKSLLQTNNERFTHNIFSQTHSKGIVEITSSIPELFDENEKNKQEISHMRRGNIFVDRDEIGNTEISNENKELNKFKKTLISVKIPSQVKTFIFCVSILILILLFIGIAEFLLTTNNLTNLNKFVDTWDNFNQRNLRFVSIILYSRVLMLLDNDIIQVEDKLNKRDVIISKLQKDINKTISLNNDLIYSLHNLDEEITYIHNEQKLYTLNLKEDFSITYREESVSFVIDFTLVKISSILEKGSLWVDKKENLFYYNKNFVKTQMSSELLRELFYIVENAISPVRFWLEKMQRRMNVMMSTKAYFDTTVRDIICYLPFLFIVLAFITFCVVLSRINDYKLKILRVFFLVDKNFGLRIMKRCHKFLENSHHFLRNSKLDIETYLDEKEKVQQKTSTNMVNLAVGVGPVHLASSNTNILNLAAASNNSNYTMSGFSGKRHQSSKSIGQSNNQVPTNNPSGNLANHHAMNGTLASIRTMNSHNLLIPVNSHNHDENTIASGVTGITGNNQEKGNSSKDVTSSGGYSPINFKDSPATPIIKERRSKKHKNTHGNKEKSSSHSNSNSNNNINQTKEDANRKDKKKETQQDFLFNSELEASKSSFRKSLCLIYLKLTILILIVAVYFAIIISINLQFTSSIFDNSEKISLYATRGWSFNNFLLYYQEMIMQNKPKGYIVNDFKNYTYLYTFESLNVIDYYHLYYNNSFYHENSILLLNSEVDNVEPSFLNQIVTLDGQMNSVGYCENLKSYDSEFYEEFQADCNNFYMKHLGLKDNIGLISGYVKSNPPNYLDRPLETLSSMLTAVLPFIDHTQIYINQGLLMEMNTLHSSFSSYVNNQIYSSVVRSIIYILLLVCEFLVFLYVTRFLSKMLNKDRTILTIIPNEAISSSERVRTALNNLRNLN